MRTLLALLLASVFVHTASAKELSTPELIRVSYHSAKMNAERDYFVYLPRGFKQQDKWPVMLFLHGNGERGDGKGELDYVLKHGPLMEAWCQQRDLPFVIISPQLPMYDQGEVDYIKKRTPAEIPVRRPGFINPTETRYSGHDPLNGQLTEDLVRDLPAQSNGWSSIDMEVMGMVDTVLAKYRGDSKRVYLTGLSRGGHGTWWLAAKHPERFAAIVPVVGPAPASYADPIAKAGLPVWAFAGGRDYTENQVKCFYPVLNRLEQLGDSEVRFTIEADLGHPAWVRVYGSEDLYRWLLAHAKP